MLQANVEQINANITIMADKLGLERQQLWDAIVRQARIEAWTDISLALFGLGMVIGGIIYLHNISKFAERNLHYGDWPLLAIGCGFLAGTSIIIGGILFVVNAYNAALILPNPIYYAYTHLVS